MVVESPHIIGLVFITPWMALLGIAGILIPLAIHLLFRRRRTTMEWAAMHLVQQAWASRKSRVRIEQMLLLISRCLIPLLLGLALAQPLFDSNWFSGGPVNRYIIIEDGITSMTRTDSGRSDLEDAKDSVLRYLETVPAGDPVTVITMSDNTTTGPTTNPETIRRIISGIESSHLPSDLRTSISVASDLIESLDDGSRSEIMLATGYRRGSLSDGRKDPVVLDSSVDLVRNTRQTSVPDNLRIVDVVPNRSFVLADADGSERLRNAHSSTATITIARDGPGYPQTSTSILVRGGTRESSRNIEWSEGRRTIVTTIDLPIDRTSDAGEAFGVEILPTDSLPEDNLWYLNMGSIDGIDMLILDRPAPGSTSWIPYALDPMSSDTMSLRTIDPVSLIESDIRGTDIIIVVRPDLVPSDSMRHLITHLESGGSIIIAPPASMNHGWVDSWNSELDVPWEWDQQVRIHDRPTGLSITDDMVDHLRSIGTELETLLTPVAVERIQIITPRDGCETILGTTNGDPFLITSPPSRSGSGSVIAFASPMNTDWTDLPTRPLMVPLFQELIRDAVSRNGTTSQHTIGVPVESTRGRFESMRSTHLPIIDFLNPETVVFDTPGHWILREDGSNPDRIHSSNIAPGSSSTSPIDDIEIRALVDHPVGWIELDSDRPDSTVVNSASVTRYIILILLVLAVGETVLSRLFTHSRYRNPGA